MAQGQTVMCSGGQADCARKSDIEAIREKTSGAADWTIISVRNAQESSLICQRDCDVPAFTFLATPVRHSPQNPVYMARTIPVAGEVITTAPGDGVQVSCLVPNPVSPCTGSCNLQIVSQTLMALQVQ